jgi:FkbM family methyltransferase
MKNIFVKSGSWLRRSLPLAQKTRSWCWKYFDRTALRLVISGGRIPFMDTVLNFPEGVGLTYSTPLFWNGPEAYETSTSRVLTLLISRSRLFLDVGSNIGIYAVYAGVKYPQVTTFAFEPVPAIRTKNARFHGANGLPETNVLQVALSDEEGSQQFFLPVYNTGVEEEQTGTLNASSWQTNEPVVEKIDVQCTTLDRFAAGRAMPEGHCCVKIDVENHEAAVLRGGRQFIQTRRPWIVCEILPGQHIDAATGKRTNENSEILELMEELQYAGFAITNEGLFRLQAPDFDQPRTFKDFLLAPAERVFGNYLAVSSLADLLPVS